MTSSLHLRHVTVGWDGVPVLRNLDFTVEAGRTIALLGESGSGKSTLLRTIAGLLPSLGGTILVGDRDVTAAAPQHRRVGMVFQAHALFPHATVGQNVAFAAAVQGADRPTRRRLADAWLERVGLAGLADRSVSTLSGGQRQRVALARTLAAEPDVVLLDEPLGALDAGLRARLLVDLRTLFDELGTTVVHVTHDPVEAATLAHTIAVLDGDRVAQTGTPEELHSQPDSAVVARLVGHPNVLDGDRLGLAHGSHDPARPIAVIPPAAIRLAPGRRGTTSGDQLTGTVTMIAPGAAWTVTVALTGGQQLTALLDPTSSSDTISGAPEVGQEVTISLETADIVWVPRHSAGAPPR